jgi:hypothetical protein
VSLDKNPQFSDFNVKFVDNIPFGGKNALFGINEEEETMNQKQDRPRPCQRAKPFGLKYGDSGKTNLKSKENV